MAYLSSCCGRFVLCNWKIHVELSNDGINGIFYLVIIADKNILCFLVVLWRQIRPENQYYFIFNSKANTENILWLEDLSLNIFELFKILKIPVRIPRLDTAPSSVSVKALPNVWL